MNKLLNISNKYTKIYFDLIDRAKKRILDKSQYSEKHHIVPKSLGGNNDQNNIVRLLAREHYISHLLLWKSFPIGSTERKKMAYAANQMRRLSCAKINSRTYAELKKEHSDNVRRDKMGNRNCEGYGHFIINKATREVTRIRIGEKIPKTHEKWHATTTKKLYYYDPTTDKEYRFSPNDTIPPNLLSGRSLSFREKVKISSRGNTSNKGKVIIHDPKTQEQRHINKKDKIPDGFIVGMADTTKKSLSLSAMGRKAPNAGKLRFHNPKTNKVIQLFPTDSIPDGFIRGMPKSFSDKTKAGMRNSNKWADEKKRRSLS